MGKLFAIATAIIGIVSAAFFAMHTWWMPVDISTTGPAVDHQFDETLFGTGILFVAGQLLLAGSRGVQRRSGARKSKTFPGGATPLVVAAIILSVSKF